MKKLILTVFIFASTSQIFASPNQYAKAYPQKSTLTSDDSKIRSCLSSLYSSQIQFRKTRGYFAALPEDLRLNRYKVCDGLEISTHQVTDSSFRMTAKFNHKIWSVDESKNIRPQQRE